MKNKVFFASVFIIVLGFVGIKESNASGISIPILTNTGMIYISANLNKQVYAPEEDIKADFLLTLGSAAPTSASATGSANGGYALFDNLVNNIAQTRTIGYAQPTPGTYSANFSYSYNQAPLGDIDAYLSVYAGYPTFGNRRCFLRVDLSSPASQSISIGASLTTSIQDLYDLRGFSFTDSVTVPSGLTISETDLGPCNNFGDLNMFPRLNPFHTTLNDGRSVYVEHGPNLWL